jgi:hypothetical protein
MKRAHNSKKLAQFFGLVIGSDATDATRCKIQATQQDPKSRFMSVYIYIYVSFRSIANVLIKKADTSMRITAGIGSKYFGMTYC